MVPRYAGAMFLALLFGASTVAAQGSASFALGSLNPPAGVLDMSDIVVTTDADGVLIATATTRVGNAEALVLLSSKRTDDGTRALTVGLKPTGWSLTEALPALSNPVLDGLTFSNVALVIAEQDVEVDAAELLDEEFAFFREVYKADDFRLVLRPGI